MRIALASDERTNLTDFLAAELRRRGHRVDLVGPPAGEQIEWAVVAERVGLRVASGEAEWGVLCC